MKDTSSCSNKYCCCGGHNVKNHKKAKTHHSTASKLSIQANRKFKQRIKDGSN